MSAPSRAARGDGIRAGTVQPVALADARPRWQRELADAFRDPLALLAFLGIDPARLARPIDPASPFRALVPRGFAALMRPGDPADPLLRQVLPLAVEREPVAGFGPDPVGDGAARLAPGLLKKYRGRALLLATGACAVHCRYCFRRHFPYGDDGPAAARIEAALAALAAAEDVEELILSGGDPLLLDDAALGALLDRAEAIGRLKRVRLHTRLPVVLPSRVTDALLARLAGGRLKAVVVIHANHPAELGVDAADALARLGAARIALLNQSVLLAGVNDDAAVLAALSERLFELGVMSYYLHQLDPVAGAAGFAVPDGRALALADALRRRLPGYLVPRLVREVPAAPYKVPLEPGPEGHATAEQTPD